jgi:DNA polymerase elongation subunit (family B)
MVWFVSDVMYGLDIETDTTINGLDPEVAAVVAVAVAGGDVSVVIRGEERSILNELDNLLRRLEPGIIVTWNGSAFDLPFLQHRAALHGITLGLELSADAPTRKQPRFRARWYGHRHLDAYLAYRYQLARVMPVSCGLKSIAAFYGLDAVEVAVERLHELPDSLVDAYVLSDAVLAAQLAARHWDWTQFFVDEAPSAKLDLGRQMEADLAAGSGPGPDFAAVRLDHASGNRQAESRSTGITATG